MQNAVAKHYLWALGEGIKVLKPGELIAGRYLFKGNQILLDTKPEQSPDIPEEIPTLVTPYLKLFPYRFHIPQVYGFIPRTASKLTTDIWLLKGGPIDEEEERVMPSLVSAWKGAMPMRQLHWLWQMAQMWQPFNSQGVASSLLNPELLRVEGQLVRLLQLEVERKSATLQKLGQLWQKFIPDAHPAIASFLTQLCQQIVKGQLQHPEQLLSQLDQALAICGRSQIRRVNIASGTHTGPSRSHNEDACYPAHNTAISLAPGPEALAIVCDGIGGQDGGEVASQLAIDILGQRIRQMPNPSGYWDPPELMMKLELSTCAANDVISSRNDQEQRQGRQRMGTTLVMGLAQAHELYITHLGDSRAYWITPTGCYQVTLDDDVATREVRLGYAIYQDALQQVAAGALVQALGITSSATLHPTVQRFQIDEDCVFLLCSDGLSDKDRVEEIWKTEILPILEGTLDVATVRDRLIEIANTRNGHDNVTIALMHFQVIPRDDGSLPEIRVPPVEVSKLPGNGSESYVNGSRGDNFDEDDETPQTRFVERPPQAQSPTMLLLGIILLLGLGGVLFYFLNPDGFNHVIHQIAAISPNASNPKPSPAASSSLSPSPTNPSPTPSSVANLSLESGSLIAIQKNVNVESGGLILWTDIRRSIVKGIVPTGSILRVVNTQESGVWLQLQVCQLNGGKLNAINSKTPRRDSLTPPGETSEVTVTAASQEFPPSPSGEKVLKEGDMGWIQQSEIRRRGDVVSLNKSIDKKGLCR